MNLILWAVICVAASFFIACESDDDAPVIVVPTLTDFSPTAGMVGSQVIISGTNFSPQGSDNIVKFNGNIAQVTAASATALTVIVPPQATSGKIALTVNNTTLTSVGDFSVTKAPMTISAIAPANGPIGTIVKITGTEFSAVALENVVKINGVTAVVNEATATALEITIPEAATKGKITITTGDRSVTSTEDFTVLSIYVAGYDGSVAKLWKDGVVTELSDDQMPRSYVNSIAISGDDVYVGGSLDGVGSYWKNGVSATVGSSAVYSIHISGSDIYSACPDAYYKNAVHHPMPTMNSSIARSILVSGNDVHIVGAEHNGTKLVARYWKNDIGADLSNGSAHATATSIAVAGTDIHVVGFDGKKARYWKNGVGTDLTDGVETGLASTIFLVGNDVYIGGNDGNTAKYWKNGQEVLLTNGASRASVNSIFVLNGVVYAAGYAYGMGFDIATLWVNGEPTNFTDGTAEGRLSAIVIK